MDPSFTYARTEALAFRSPRALTNIPARWSTSERFPSAAYVERLTAHRDRPVEGQRGRLCRAYGMPLARGCALPYIQYCAILTHTLSMAKYAVPHVQAETAMPRCRYPLRFQHQAWTVVEIHFSTFLLGDQTCMDPGLLPKIT